MCSLKPGSERCKTEIKDGAKTTGCSGCPVSSGKNDTCQSTHHGGKREAATANALAARITAQSKAVTA